MTDYTWLSVVMPGYGWLYLVMGGYICTWLHGYRAMFINFEQSDPLKGFELL